RTRRRPARPLPRRGRIGGRSGRPRVEPNLPSMPVPSHLELVVDGLSYTVDDDGASLLEVLRDRIGSRSVKDGCSPQGQCGCCTVLVDGAPRVACVTPARRVDGRAITTVDGLPDADAWAAAFTATGASPCGFCTPGTIVRLAAATSAVD